MPAEVASRVLELAEDSFKEVFNEKGRRPTANAVRDRMNTKGYVTLANPWDTKSSRCIFPLYPLPGVSWVTKFIKSMKSPQVAPEDYWSINRLSDIDPAAIGALVAVWTYATTTPALQEPFTYEVAEWVAKLRFLPQAGGSAEGQATTPRDLLRWAAQFSARERTARKLNETDARTNVLLAKLTMTETQYALATQNKVIDDEGIDLEQELLNYYPSQGLQAHVRTQQIAGERPDIDTYIKLADELLAKYPVEVREAWHMGLGVAMERFPEWNELRDDDEHSGAGPSMAVALLKDITEYYDVGKPLTEYKFTVRVPLIIHWFRDQWKDGNPGTIKIGKIPQYD
jgi:hypothetical protein